MSQATLERELAPEADNSAHGSFAKSALRVVLLSVVVTALVAGLYAMFGGNGTDPLATSGGGIDKTVPAKDQAAAPAVKKPLTYAELAQKRAAKLSSASGTSRDKLIKYLDQMDIKITAASSPATAATSACTLLKSGTSPNALINGIATGSTTKYTTAQSRAFLLGATTLYCPAQAKNFR